MQVLIGNPAYHRVMGDGIERLMLGSGIRFPWSMLKHRGERPRFAIFPMFLGYTAALLEQDGFHVSVLDAVPLDIPESTFIEHAVNLQPDVMLIDPTSANITDVLATLVSIKQQIELSVVLVGTHATAEFRELLKTASPVDFVVRGEFEYGALDLLRALRDGRSTQDIPGIVCRGADGSLPVKTGYARQVERLDELPTPARHLFPSWFDNDMTQYKDGFYQASPAFDMHASRGCPYSCNFCAWVHVLYQNGPHRTRNVVNVVDEMQWLQQRHGAREIYFDDDNFSANRRYVQSLCEELRRRGNPVAWSALTDAIALNDGLLETMSEAGCIGIKFGLDSADADVLRKTNKPLKVSRIQPIVEKAAKLGIKTHMTVVLGLSGETRQSLERTFEFACQLDIDSIQISLATPIPGTPLYETLASEQKLRFTRWDELDGYASTVIEYEDFSRAYLESFVADAHTRWLRARLQHPRWVLRQMRYLTRLGRQSGPEGLQRRFRRFIRIIKGDSTACVGAGNIHTLEQQPGQHTPTVRW